jgi:hypothetical protein
VDDLGPLVLRAVRLVTVRPDLNHWPKTWNTERGFDSLVSALILGVESVGRSFGRRGGGLRSPKVVQSLA